MSRNTTVRAAVISQPISRTSETQSLLQSRNHSTVQTRPTGNMSVESSHSRSIFWSFWMLGGAILLSWNVLICTLPTLTSFLPAESTLSKTLASYVTTTFTLFNFVFLGIAQRGVGKVDQTNRLNIALVNMIALLALFAICFAAVFPFAFYGAVIPSVMFLLTIALAANTALLQSSVIALASQWGSSEMLAVMSGMGGIAVLISVAQFVLSLLNVLSVRREKNDTAPLTSRPVTKGEIVVGTSLWILAALASFGCFVRSRKIVKSQPYKSVTAPAEEASEELFSGVTEEGDIEEVSIRARKADVSGNWEIFKKNVLLNISVAFVFVVTLSVFPSVTAKIISVRDPAPKLLQPALFIPFHFVVFNVADYVGRTYLPTMPALFITDRKRVLALSVGRLIFIPLMLGCNTATSEIRSTPFFNSDILYFFILFAFAASNGWISSLSMILSSSPALNPAIKDEEKDIAGTLAGFCLTAGLLGGSIASFAVGRLI